jgi:hypothetical protein
MFFNINSPFQPSKKPAPAKFSPSSSSSWSVAGSMFARVFILSLVAFLLVCVSLFLRLSLLSSLALFVVFLNSFNENEEEEEEEEEEKPLLLEDKRKSRRRRCCCCAFKKTARFAR